VRGNRRMPQGNRSGGHHHLPSETREPHYYRPLHPPNSSERHLANGGSPLTMASVPGRSSPSGVNFIQKNKVQVQKRSEVNTQHRFYQEKIARCCPLLPLRWEANGGVAVEVDLCTADDNLLSLPSPSLLRHRRRSAPPPLGRSRRWRPAAPRPGCKARYPSRKTNGWAVPRCRRSKNERRFICMGMDTEMWTEVRRKPLCQWTTRRDREGNRCLPRVWRRRRRKWKWKPRPGGNGEETGECGEAGTKTNSLPTDRLRRETRIVRIPPWWKRKLDIVFISPPPNPPQSRRWGPSSHPPRSSSTSPTSRVEAGEPPRGSDEEAAKGREEVEGGGAAAAGSVDPRPSTEMEAEAEAGWEVLWAAPFRPFPKEKYGSSSNNRRNRCSMKKVFVVTKVPYPCVGWRIRMSIRPISKGPCATRKGLASRRSTPCKY